MREMLYQYLILNSELCLPGIGMIRVQRNSSDYDFGERIFTGPSFTFSLDGNEGTPSPHFYTWMRSVLNLPEEEVIQRVHDFAADLKNKIVAAGQADFLPAGILFRKENGAIVLDANLIVPESELPVFAEKVIRENAAHYLRVGEKETTTEGMQELLTEHTAKKNPDWIIAIILTLLALFYSGWYLSQKGFSPAATGNQSVIRVH